MMKMNVILCIVLFCFIGCNNASASPLVGTWIFEDIQSLSMELFKDGSGIIKDSSESNEVKITWTSTESGRLTLYQDDGIIFMESDYKITGSILTLDDETKLRKK